MKKAIKTVLRIFLTLLLAAVGIVVLAAATLLVLPLTEGVDRTEVPGSADWMAALDDGKALGSIVIPGTHNSGAEYAQLAFFSKCQSMSVREQLEAGYRYRDIRLSGDPGDEELRLTHGFTNCKPTALSNRALMLSDVLDDCYAFLGDHPTETVLFCAKHEDGDISVREIQTILAEEIGKRRDSWLLAESLPSLGEARGKIVLLRRWQDDAGLGADSGVPFGWADQGGVPTTVEDVEANFIGDLLLWVQDRYEYNTEDKWTAFLSGLETGVGEDEAAVHFLSTKGTLAYGHPYYFAKRLNPMLEKLSLSEIGLPEGASLGWIVVDFGSAKLAEHIYAENFR
ncbi:MAG: phosphatidylinositol-specific phospholipase C domain-containing protein [Ruminococcaceae bacterium]|jgi:1-phosphatidylinositol phosphodiesterase|nr:phosphatidylinositol-specific phospholipase C domain-containing protein [Oscillospiraceae bacterium]